MDKSEVCREGRTALILAITAVTFAGLNYPAYGQAPKDVEGWREARWGMTESQPLETFRGEAIVLDKEQQTSGTMFHATTGIPKLDVEGMTLTARFQFDNVTNKPQGLLLNQPMLSRTQHR